MNTAWPDGDQPGGEEAHHAVRADRGDGRHQAPVGRRHHPHAGDLRQAVTQAAFAARIGWTRARLNEFIRGKRGVTADAALDLAKVLGTSSKIWMNLQATFDLAEAVRRRSAA